MKLPVYLDYSATTPCDPRVVDKMVPYLYEKFGNPASHSHAYGWEGEKAVEEARGHVAALIGADPREIVWTSGATESDNLAIKGAAHFYKDKGRHLITVKTEHKAVLDSMRHLESEGYEVTYLDVKEDGLIDMDAFRAAIRPDTILVSVMAINNEIGVIQDLETISAICHEHGILFHCDATQAAGKMDLNVDRLKVDLMSLSGHKVMARRVSVRSMFAVSHVCVSNAKFMVVVMNAVCVLVRSLLTRSWVWVKTYRLAKEEMETEVPRLQRLRDRLWDGIRENIPEVYLNGSWNTDLATI